MITAILGGRAVGGKLYSQITVGVGPVDLEFGVWPDYYTGYAYQINVWLGDLDIGGQDG